MDKKLVKKYMQKYKLYSDWIEIYNDQLTSGMGMSYEGVGGKSEGFNSDVENRVTRRDKKNKEYKAKKEYIKLIDKIIDKLSNKEKLILKMKYNLDNEKKLKDYQVTPDKVIYEDDRFDKSPPIYYNIKKSMYSKMTVLLGSISKSLQKFNNNF